MLGALEATGWSNHSLFLRREHGLLIGYETESLDAALAGREATEVNGRWQAETAGFFDHLSGRPDTGSTRLTEIFHLKDQLAPLEPDYQLAPLEPDNQLAPLEPDNQLAPLEPDNQLAPLDRPDPGRRTSPNPTLTARSATSDQRKR
jgi:L-rhamnose mutarotase